MTVEKKVLVIDDDQQFRNYMVELLTEHGYKVCTAENGVAGLEQFSNCQPDIIITDIVMPEKEGVEVILTIRAENPEIPLIAVSGGNLGNAESYLNMARKLGANATLAKPFSLSNLLETVDRLLVA